MLLFGNSTQSFLYYEAPSTNLVEPGSAAVSTTCCTWTRLGHTIHMVMYFFCFVTQTYKNKSKLDTGGTGNENGLCLLEYRICFVKEQRKQKQEDGYSKLQKQNLSSIKSYLVRNLYIFCLVSILHVRIGCIVTTPENNTALIWQVSFAIQHYLLITRYSCLESRQWMQLQLLFEQYFKT